MKDEKLDRVIEALERSAKAQEDLIVLATEERDSNIFGPPLCPHCGTLNPDVHNGGGEGPMAEFALIATCGSCAKTLFAVPQGWLCFTTRDEALKEIEGRIK